MIRRQVFDLHLDDEDQAKPMQDLISNIFSTHLSPLIESVLDEFSHPDELLTIPKIEIDVGEILPEKFVEELERKLRIALRQALASSIAAHSSTLPLGGMESVQRVPIVQAKLDLLVHFLQFGYLSPWARGKQIDLAVLMKELLENDATGLVRRLQEVPNQKQVIQRLVEQFSSDQLTHLQQLLSPAQANYFLKAGKTLEAIFHKLPGTKPSVAQFRKILTRNILTYLLTEYSENKQLNKENWVADLSRTFFSLVNEEQKDHFVQQLLEKQKDLLPGISTPETHSFQDQLTRIWQQSREEISVVASDEKREESIIPSTEEPTKKPEREDPLTNIVEREKSVSPPKESLSIEAQIDLLIFYVREGQWPWWAAKSLQPDVPDELLDRLLQQHPQLVKQKLEDDLFSGPGLNEQMKDSSSGRLAKEVKKESQLHLTELIYPGFSGFMLLLIRFFEESFEKEQEIIGTVWQTVWQYKMTYPSQAMNISQLLSFLIPQTARKVNQPKSEFSRSLLRTATARVRGGESRFIAIQSSLMQYVQTDSIKKEDPRQIDSLQETEKQQSATEYDKKPDEKERFVRPPTQELSTDHPITEIPQDESEQAEKRDKDTSSDAVPQKETIEDNIRENIQEESPAEEDQLEEEGREEIQEPKVTSSPTQQIPQTDQIPPDDEDKQESLEEILKSDEPMTEEKKEEESSSKRLDVPHDSEVVRLPIPELEITELAPSDRQFIKQELRLFSYFMRFGSLPPSASTDSREDFDRRIQQLIQIAPKQVGRLLNKMLYVPQNRQRLVQGISDSLFENLLSLLPATQGSDLMDHYQAFRKLSEPLREQLSVNALKHELLAYLIATQSRTPVPYQYILRVMRRSQRTTSPSQGNELLTDLLDQIPKTPGLSLKQELTGILTLIEKDWKARPPQSQTTAVPVHRKALPLGDMPIDISNAGLVLVWPFIPHYFKMLEKLTPRRQFIDEDFPKRAVHLLQYIVRKSTADPEEQLVLNKLMCGLPLSEPIEESIQITEKEAEMAEGLLQAACGQWKAMKNGTPDGLRGSFLIREGSLEKKLKNWELKVEKKPFDMLLDHLPWSISMVKFPWMDSIIQVEWR
ncbi:MAG: contractile injection system tape measure protein [Bacteroidota bacterium]